jgi:hypothetical protein
MYVDLPKIYLYEKVLFSIYHSIKLPFDAKVAEKFLNGIYLILTKFSAFHSDLTSPFECIETSKVALTYSHSVTFKKNSALCCFSQNFLSNITTEAL